jgi:hypothetical protein
MKWGGVNGGIAMSVAAYHSTSSSLPLSAVPGIVPELELGDDADGDDDAGGHGGGDDGFSQKIVTVRGSAEGPPSAAGNDNRFFGTTLPGLRSESDNDGDYDNIAHVQGMLKHIAEGVPEEGNVTGMICGDSGDVHNFLHDDIGTVQPAAARWRIAFGKVVAAGRFAAGKGSVVGEAGC